MTEKLPTNIEKIVIGITGGIGAGKSAATSHFETLGIDVIDADLVARKVVEPGSHVLAEIQAHFGDELLLADGNLNRAKLREIIFSDENEKQWLNALMHPVIRLELLTQLQNAQSPYVLLSAPLLFENNLDALCQRVLVIDVSEETQQQRASHRDGVNAEQIKAIIASQISRMERLQRADDVIDNEKGIEQLHFEVEKFHENYLNLRFNPENNQP